MPRPLSALGAAASALHALLSGNEPRFREHAQRYAVEAGIFEDVAVEALHKAAVESGLRLLVDGLHAERDVLRDALQQSSAVLGVDTSRPVSP